MLLRFWIGRFLIWLMRPAFVDRASVAPGEPGYTRMRDDDDRCMDFVINRRREFGSRRKATEP